MKDKMLIEQWVSTFGKNVDKRIIKKHVTAKYNHLWHLFTWGEVSCLEGDEARKAFDSLQYTQAIRFVGGRSNHIEDVCEIEKISAEALDNDPESDIYIVAKDFSWTYVRTHERGSCGPYLCVLEILD